MRRYFLLLMMLTFTASCSRPDFDTSAQVQAWLESLDPTAKVIEVWCKADVEKGGTWVKQELKNKLSAAEVLKGSGNRGLEWEDIVARTIEIIKKGFPGWVLDDEMGNTIYTPEQQKRFLANFRYKNLSCDGKALRSPPIQIGKCPNSTDGCDEPPDPLDQPLLPPPPSPGGGGDF